MLCGRYYRRNSYNGFAVAGQTVESSDPTILVFHDTADFLAASFAGQGLLDALFLSRLQVKGMFLHFFNDVFLLDLPLETPKRILNGLSVLNANFGHSVHLPSPLKSSDYPKRSTQSQTYLSG
jgi:hypothetical protein